MRSTDKNIPDAEVMEPELSPGFPFKETFMEQHGPRKVVLLSTRILKKKKPSTHTMGRRRRRKKKRHPNNKRKAKIVYPKFGKTGCGFTEEMVLEENVEDRIAELQARIAAESND